MKLNTNRTSKKGQKTNIKNKKNKIKAEISTINKIKL